MSHPGKELAKVWWSPTEGVVLLFPEGIDEEQRQSVARSLAWHMATATDLLSHYRDSRHMYAGDLVRD